MSIYKVRFLSVRVLVLPDTLGCFANGRLLLSVLTRSAFSRFLTWKRGAVVIACLRSSLWAHSVFFVVLAVGYCFPDLYLKTSRALESLIWVLNIFTSIFSSGSTQNLGSICSTFSLNSIAANDVFSSYLLHHWMPRDILWVRYGEWNLMFQWWRLESWIRRWRS